MMKTYKSTIKNFRRAIFAAVLLFAGAVKAQTVNITINVLPPYSPYYSDYTSAYASKTLLILQNTSGTQQKIRLTGKLQGDNGILISTRGNYRPAQPIILNPHETKQLNGTTLQSVFDLNSVNVYGIDKAKLAASSRIPEGHYTLCIEAYEFSGVRLLSANAPMGCSMITITNPDPPVLVGPARNERLRATPANTAFFNWINPGAVPLGTQYKVEIAEMPDPAKDPNQILNASSLPVLTTVVTGTSYQYNMRNVPFKPGKSYAWRVTAIDPNNRVVFRNNGRSPASVFIYEQDNGKDDKFGPTKPGHDLSVVHYDYQVSGNLTYKYHLANDKQMPYIKTARRDTAVPLKLTKIELVYGLCYLPMDIHQEEIKEYKKGAPAKGSKIGDSMGKGVGKQVKIGSGSGSKTDFGKPDDQLVQQQENKVEKYNGVNGNANAGSQSDKGVNAAIKNGKYVPYTPPVIDTIDQTGDLLLPATDYGSQNIVATAKTDANGHYEFDFDSKLPCKIIQAYPESNVAMVMCYYINVINKQYSDPHSFIYAKPPVDKDETTQVDAGTQNVFVNNYRLHVLIDRNPEGGTNTGKVAGASVEGTADDTVQVYVLRKLPRSPSIPNDEGDNVGHAPFKPVDTTASWYVGGNKYEIVSHHQSSMNHEALFNTYTGSVIFDNLVDNLTASDSYYVYAEYKHSKVSFEPVELSMPPVEDDDYQPYTKPFVRYKDIDFRPSYVSFTVKGVLKYRFKDGSARPLPNTAIVLESIPMYPDGKGNIVHDENKAKMYAAVLTDPNGYFELNSGVLQYDQLELYNYNNGFGFQQYLKVFSPYYGSPDIAYSFRAGNTYNVGEVIAQVKDFNLNVIIKGYNSNTKLTEKLKNQRVYLCRLTGFNYAQFGIPDDEGQQNGLEQKTIQDYYYNNYKVIGYGVTNTDGVASFSRLVSNDVYNASDKYYIYSESEILTGDNYSTVSAQQVDPHVAIFTANGHYFDEPVLNSIVGQKNVSVDVTVNTVAQKPYIDGAVYPQSNTSTNALSQVLVWLYDIDATKKAYNAQYFKDLFAASDPLTVLDYMTQWNDSPVQLQKIQQTGDNGLFRFDDPETDDYKGWKLLVFTKYGFITGFAVVNSGIPMGPGRKENVKGLVLPPRRLQADVIDHDTKKPVKARIVVGDGFSWTDTETLYAFQGAPSPNEERAQMQTSYGQVKFTVIPDDQVNYHTQTFTRTVDAPPNIGLANAGAIDDSYSQMEAFEMLRPVNKLSVCVKSAVTKKAIPAQVYITQLPPDEAPGGDDIKAGECASFTFQSSATKYGVKVMSAGYVTQETTVIATNSPDAVTFLDIKLDEGFSIIGTIKVDGKPKANVGVYIKEMWQTVKEVYTDQNGKYSIDGLAKDGSTITVVASNPAGPGATKKVKLESSMFKNIVINSAQADFSLTSNAAIDFSSIYGFPIEVESWVKSPTSSNYILNGRVQVKPNKNIYMGNYYNNFLTLKNVEVKVIERVPKNATDQYGRPLPPYIIVGGQGSIGLVENNVDLLMFKYYHATASGLNGLSLQQAPNDPGRGSIVGEAAITSNSFSHGVVWKGSQSVIPFVDDGNGVIQQGQNGVTPADQQQVQFDNSNKAANDILKNGGNDGNNSDNMSLQMGVSNGGFGQMQVYSPGSPDVFADGLGAATKNFFKLFVSKFDDDNTYKYRVQSLNGKTFKYTLNNLYNADASAASYLDYTGLHLASTVHTNIANINNPDLNLNVGYLIFDYKSMVQTFSKSDLIISFDKWKAQGKWTLDQGTIKLTGNLFAGSITVPVSNLEIGYDNIGYGYMSIDKIGIAGVKDLPLGSNVATSFGYDKAAKYGSLKNPQYGAWSLSMVSTSDAPVTVIKDLPDLGTDDQILISNISLYSKGDESRIVISNSQKPLKLNGFATFTPYQVANGIDNISFDGSLDLNIPALTGMSDKIYNLAYKSNGTSLVHLQTNLPPLDMVTNGVHVTFENTGQTFINNQLMIPGHLKDKAPNSPYNFKVKLLKYNVNSHMISVTQDKSNFMEMGGSQKLSAIEGTMIGDFSSWQNFKFIGDVIGAEGMRDSTSVDAGTNKTRMGFVVQGDLVANKSQIGVKNLSFGDMSNGNFTYDFDKKAIVGSFHLDESTPNAEFHTDFELQLGSGQWYVLGMAKIDHITGSPVPVNSANGAVWIGASTITPGIQSIIQSQFHDGILPDGFKQFNTLKGTLLVTAVDMNLPIIPDINLNVGPIASVTVEKGIYANIFTAIDFGGKNVNIDGGIKVGAYVKVHAGASVLVGCAGLNLSAEVNSTVVQHVGLPPFSQFGFDPAALLSASDLTMSASAHVILSGSAYVGFGVCDDNCNSIKVFGVKIPPGCHSTGIGKSMDLGMGVNVTKPPGQLTPTEGNLWVSIFDNTYNAHVDIPGLKY